MEFNIDIVDFLELGVYKTKNSTPKFLQLVSARENSLGLVFI